MVLFKVIDKNTRESFDVYDIMYDAITGYPQFLIYKDGQWLRVSAKHYKPRWPSEEVYDFEELADSMTKFERDGVEEYMKKCEEED